jgi:hypothetical protein
MAEIKRCLVCNNPRLAHFFDLGVQPLANNLKKKPSDKDKFYPVDVMFCPICSHKQLSISVDPEKLFSNYLYKSGISLKHIEFFNKFADSVRGVVGNKSLDIGSNDGVLMNCLHNRGWDVMGVEPSDNFKPTHDDKVIRDFFPTKVVLKDKFDLITAFNVFGHNDDPRAFLEEMKRLLNPNGRIFILTTQSSLSNYYHEHISYFTPQSMMILCGFCDLQVRSFRETDMHDNSLLFEISFPETHKDVAKIEQTKNMVGYGASAGATVLLNYFGLKLDYVVDDNTLKQGKYIPGVNVPICSAEYLQSDDRDLDIVILAHNLFDEIVASIKKLRPDHNDVFIHPLGER